MINFVLTISSDNGLLGCMPQLENSSTVIVRLNLKCVVLPSGMSNAAIPFEVMVNTIIPLERIADDRALQIIFFCCRHQSKMLICQRISAIAQCIIYQPI